MDTFALVATVVLVAFIAWIVARNLGRRSRARDRDSAAGLSGTWAGGTDSRRDGDHHDGDAGDGGGGDGGAGGH